MVKFKTAPNFKASVSPYSLRMRVSLHGRNWYELVYLFKRAQKKKIRQRSFGNCLQHTVEWVTLC